MYKICINLSLTEVQGHWLNVNPGIYKKPYSIQNNLSDFSDPK